MQLYGGGFFLFYVGLMGVFTLSTDRELDPVVVLGADLPSLLGCVECVDNLVAFSWGEQGWTQVPVQVDERHYQDWYTIKNNECRLFGRNLTELVYADAGTFSGQDEDNALDADDEVVVMARHRGDKWDGSNAPDGVVGTVTQELEIVEPLDGETIGYIYLYLSDGSLDQGAGQNLVSYTFNLTASSSEGSHDYFDVYKFGTSMHGWVNSDIENKEDSTFESSFYRRHFRENWNSDGLRITAGDSTGEEMLGHQDFQFGETKCGRCVDTFMHGSTAFIANKVGPVRAIRSWVGANSGIVTQRETYMYEQREDLHTFLRVHQIPGLMDYVVYAEDLPLTFYNCHNKHGISIDGNPDGDSFHKSFCPWEIVTGRSGSVFRASQLHTDLGDFLGVPESQVAGMALDSWFYDNSHPTQVDESGVAHYPGFWFCSGKLMEQKAAWGTHGFITKDYIPGVPNTCPYRGNPHPDTPEGCDNMSNDSNLFRLEVAQNSYYLPPGLDVDNAQSLHDGATHPLTIRKNEA